MQQIADWLEKLGMSEYAQRFAENRIDFSVLPELTDQHLKDLGLPLGDRLKMLRAIREFSGAVPAAPQAEPRSQDTAERRQVTVMFSDLVGSTALSARMDPEDLREVISAYQKRVAETVQRYDGFVAKYMGDGVLVYFGYPQAHEDDAERAVRAGLELVAAVGQVKTHAALRTRIGIATGLGVVGDLIGSGEAQERGIVGETPNLAARLQDVAKPNGVVIAESTRKLIGDLFELEDLGLQELKGIAGAVRTWAALRPASIESRFDALHTTGFTELVGREEELDLLLRRWSKAKTGEGQVVLLSGEPGIGKSRLTAALLERAAPEPHTRFRYFCSPQHTDSAFFPIIGQMERAAGFTHADAGQAKLDKLDAVLALASTSKQDAALFAEMLSLPNDGRYHALEMTPQQRRQKTLEAVFAQVETFALKNPVLMVFEDAHWSDPTSLEAFGRAVNRLTTLAVLLLITFRPEFEPPWVGQPHVTALTINRLTRGEVDAMIDRVAGNKPMPTNIRQEIIERTDGIPLFVEEITKAVLEAESEGAAERTVAAIPSPAVAVPATLQASLMARLDRLGGPAKEVAQIGATIGREFLHVLLAAVVAKPKATLEAALDRLVASGLLFRQGTPPHATYLFKHALVQDAAYGTLLREPRRVLHARVAETLESQFADIAENQPEVLARHCTEAGQIAKAARLWGKAGQRSLARSALVEAVEQLTRALAQIAMLPATPALRREQIKLQVALVTPLIHVKGYAAPETRAAAEQARLLIERAEALGEAPEDPLLIFSVLYAFWVANFLAFSGDLCRDLAAHFLALAEKQGDIVAVMVGHSVMGTTLVFTGEIAESRSHLDRALALYDPAEHRPLATWFGQDVGVASLAYRTMALWMLGYPEAALADAERILNDARAIGQAGTLMFALCHAFRIYLFCGDYATGNATINECIALAKEKNAVFWKAAAITLKERLLVTTGKASEAVQAMTSARNERRLSGSTAYAPSAFTSLSSAYAILGQFDEAERYIAKALTAMATTKETWCEADVLRAAGEITLMAPEPDAAKAEAYFERALAVARCAPP